MVLKISRATRLTVVVAISSAFFVAEISGHFIASLADATLNDLVGFVVALVALKVVHGIFKEVAAGTEIKHQVSEAGESPKALSFGWQRAQLLGAFFNGVLLFALGISIFLQSIERFITLQRVENPKLMFIMGAIGLTLNLISATFLHGNPGFNS
ncbi:hypothetical protein AbraIFM66951_006189 [Aspergillus brasiliensis]|nr:hypothetical protein AbraIFM66951_006189 [Aspergillus brasiliensis]